MEQQPHVALRLEEGRGEPVAAQLAAVLAAYPFGGRGELLAVHDGLDIDRPGVIVCVPARDEAERILATLDTVAASLDRLEEPSAIVVAVNNSTDATFGLARMWAIRNDRPLFACEVRFEESIADAGHARRLAFDAGALFARADGVMLSTDADTHVEPFWASRMVAHVRRGAGLAVGQIDTNRAEFDAMPRAVRDAEALERQLLALQDRMWPRLVPDAPQALGLRAGGANLAVSLEAYDRVGGAPVPSFGEDRALVALMLRHDERVALDRAQTIQTSCRLEARAAAGMGGMLKMRLAEPDPLTDEVLLPARSFALRALAWRHLRDARRSWRVGDIVRGVEALAGALPVDPVALFPAAQTLGRDWERLAQELETPPRLRVSELGREIEDANAILARTTPEAAVQTQVEEIVGC